MPLDAASLKIVHYPAEVLRKRAKPVEKIDAEVKAVALRMLELMHETEGVGLAAPQVGLPWRLFVTRAEDDDGKDEVHVNPTLAISNPELDVMEEGCLSLPDIRADIQRPKGMTLTSTDLEGRQVTRSSEEFIARVWQHEMDHLNGVMIIDKMAPIDRLAFRKALKELEVAAASELAKSGRRVPGAVP